MNSLTKLEELTKSLEDITTHGSKTTTEYLSVGGTITGHGLLHVPDIAIQKVHVPKGASVTIHDHGEVEYAIIYRGKVTIIEKGRDYVLEVGEHAKFEPGVAHSLKALEDTWMLCITIPSSKGYPNA